MTLDIVYDYAVALFLGVMMDRKELTSYLIRRFQTLQTVRKRNEKERWFAMALANHRTKSASLSDSPVPVIYRHTDSAMNAIDDFVNYFQGNLVSPNIPWLGMVYESADMQEQDDMVGANEFMGKVRNAVLSEMASSNFYPENRLATKDEYTGAISAVLVRNDPARNICVYKTLTPWDYWVDTDQYGEYDTLFYKKTMNVSQAYEMFGEKLPKWMKDILTDGEPFESWYDFLLCIYPRNKVYPKKRSMFVKNKNFAVVWMFLNEGNMGVNSSGPSEIIDESGSDFFPVCISSWDKDGDNPYGTCPVMRNVTSINRLDSLAYETALSVKKMNHPAFTGVQSALEGFSDDPGARNAVSSPELAPVPVPITQTVEGAMELQNQQEQAVQKMFNNDIFNFLSRNDDAKVFTATQVNATKAEQLSLLAAVYGNYQNRIEKLVKLTVMTMSENGRLPEGAKDIYTNRGKLRVIIESTLAQELRAYTNRDANIALLEQCANLMQIERPDALLNYDFDEIARGIAKGLGVDYKVLKDKAVVEMEREMIQQQQQQQQEMQMALAQSEVNRNNAGAANLNNAQGNNQYGG